MSIEMMIILFVLSIIVCTGAQEIVKRRSIQIPKVASVLFHIVFIAGLVASFVLL
ncbi:MAG: hypothetical protein ACXAAO_02455 [Candidatus Thorarchaeota archaeon]|jgi:hypothetical protein